MGEMKTCANPKCDKLFVDYNNIKRFCTPKCQDRERYYRKRDSRQESIFVRKYGINYEQRNKMVQDQNGKCAICECELTWDHRKTTSLHVDHCHETGTVRGILCASCNMGIGCLQDDPAILRSAVNYLIETGNLSRNEDR